MKSASARSCNFTFLVFFVNGETGPKVVPKTNYYASLVLFGVRDGIVGITFFVMPRLFLKTCWEGTMTKVSVLLSVTTAR